MAYQRPPFWRFPRTRRDPEDDYVAPTYRRVTPGTPAGRELIRGDIIAKVDDYDARDLRHEDAQNLFRNAGNTIRVVVQRTPSPMPASAPWKSPTDTLPKHSPNYLQVQYDGENRYLLSPTSSRATDDTTDEAIGNQPYRTTPLVLPGAKVRREPGPTESYLRHHPNPAMRAAPHHDYRDILMKQKVADSVLQRVVGEDAGNKVVHKQFNSPINLYSDSNIANSIRQNQGPVPSNGHYGRHILKSHKTTVLYDPAKSDTFKALQEEGLGDVVQEVPTPIQTKVFTAPPNKRPAPTPKPAKQEVVKTTAKKTTFVNSLTEESIQQSNSFKRLMYNVLGDSEF